MCDLVHVDPDRAQIRGVVPAQPGDLPVRGQAEQFGPRGRQAQAVTLQEPARPAGVRVPGAQQSEQQVLVPDVVMAEVVGPVQRGHHHA